MVNHVYVEQLTKSLNLSLFFTMSRPYSTFDVEIRAGNQFHFMIWTSAPVENCLRLKNCLNSISLADSVSLLLWPFKRLKLVRYPDSGWFSAKNGSRRFFLQIESHLQKGTPILTKMYFWMMNFLLLSQSELLNVDCHDAIILFQLSSKDCLVRSREISFPDHVNHF